MEPYNQAPGLPPNYDDLENVRSRYETLVREHEAITMAVMDFGLKGDSDNYSKESLEEGLTPLVEPPNHTAAEADTPQH